MSSSDFPEPHAFWGEIAPCQHFAQFYEDDPALLDTLSEYVRDGLRRDETAIVIATPEHLLALQQRIVAAGADFNQLVLEDRYIPLDAETTLATFMVNQWPDDQSFSEMVDSLLQRGTIKNRRVRAFGEMVALLWARGDAAATVRLEHLWHQLCQRDQFSLFCAYPKAGFTKEPSESIAEICAVHSRVIQRLPAAA